MESKGSARRVPTQQRSRQLTKAVREAGALILEEEGAKALTTTRIAERAGVSVGSLYQYFENKEAVLRAIYEEHTAREIESARYWVAGLRELSPRARAAESIRWAFDQHRKRLRLDPEFYRNNHRDISVSTKLIRAEGEDSATTSLARGLLSDAGEIMREVNLDHAAVLLGCGVPGLLRGVLDERPELLQDDAFRETVVDLVCSWLFGESSD